eukprot:comp5520_c0_seq1/m.4855 comp5520_c0_seq1/g.4855  ORF comp5520_c0_seq1/g.4855 comp5520_c0_seq1/m.4855 type:complete len:304 (-) comp5520_c0_seq1:8-919(-)
MLHLLHIHGQQRNRRKPHHVPVVLHRAVVQPNRAALFATAARQQCLAHNHIGMSENALNSRQNRVHRRKQTQRLLEPHLRIQQLLELVCTRAPRIDHRAAPLLGRRRTCNKHILERRAAHRTHNPNPRSFNNRIARRQHMRTPKPRRQIIKHRGLDPRRKRGRLELRPRKARRLRNEPAACAHNHIARQHHPGLEHNRIPGLELVCIHGALRTLFRLDQLDKRLEPRAVRRTRCVFRLGLERKTRVFVLAQMRRRLAVLELPQLSNQPFWRSLHSGRLVDEARRNLKRHAFGNQKVLVRRSAL